ncbi:putative ABC transport system permease protein [Acetitomaculum ruminis DSM 5522]|uniref:Putative ABC transport system permease protein n=1 Tax=Acetitomaculum ruminis DSM 5522 TaxID=1120918 RepID=A0A1I0Z4I5_9FIRM|nr:ABC transporter permease [Acetitomaculum ruminis]SFB20247.1 putative ABC transport system permease protein [Acetitomaculum ruminis DSM 5522]
MIENIRLSFQGIWGHKLRSLLTMLGIIIGIAAIIAIVSTIKGTNEQIKRNLIGSGNNTVKVELRNSEDEYGESQVSALGLPEIDKNVINQIEEFDEVESAVVYHSTSVYSGLYYKNNSLSNGHVYGTTAKYFDVAGLKIKQGRGFMDSDISKYRKVAIIDNESLDAFFIDGDPIGQTIEIQKEPFTIIGVVTESEEFEPVINSEEDYYSYQSEAGGNVYVPYSIWPTIYGYDLAQNVLIKASTTDEMSKAGKTVADYLNSQIPQSQQTPAGQESAAMGDQETLTDVEGDKGDADISGEGSSSKSGISYKAEDKLEEAKQLQQLSTATNQQLIWIASISLLVGGIGVMNIMLVSVTERTSEIGLKKAIGARKGQIMLQFLTEAAVLTSLGGLIGVIAGIVLAQAISKLSSTPVAISVPAAVLGVVFSMLIGIVFGLLPSRKAANLNPIEALRHE